MIYFLIRPLTRLAFLAFYRKIHLTGMEHIPTDRPLILTANHPTAFIEPCFLACFNPRVLYFMTRGDVFANRWVNWLLQQVHLIPIFRFHDGFSAMRRNDASFAAARKVLGRGGAILIMAEGRMAHEKRLRPLQKGAARIGFGAMAEYDLKDVMIQPVGVNYTYAEQAGSTIMVDFAPAFSLSDYLDQYANTPQDTLQRVTDRIRIDLEERVVHIDRAEDESLAELVLQLVRIHHPGGWPIMTHDRNPMLVEVRAMQQLAQLDVETKARLYQQALAYDQKRQEAGIQDETVVSAPTWHAAELGLLLVLRMVRGLTFLLQAPPLWFGRWITGRTVRVIEFRSSVLLGATMFAWAIWVFLVSIATGLMFGIWGGISVFFVFFGLAAIYSMSGRLVDRLMESRRWSRLPKEAQIAILASRMAWKDAWQQQTEGLGGI